MPSYTVSAHTLQLLPVLLCLLMDFSKAIKSACWSDKGMLVAGPAARSGTAAGACGAEADCARIGNVACRAAQMLSRDPGSCRVWVDRGASLPCNCTSACLSAQVCSIVLECLPGCDGKIAWHAVQPLYRESSSTQSQYWQRRLNALQLHANMPVHGRSCHESRKCHADCHLPAFADIIFY